MKKIFCCLLAAVLILGTFAGCKKQDTSPTDSTGTKQPETTGTPQTQNTEPVQTENTGTAKPGNTEVTQPDATEETVPENTEATQPETEMVDPYPTLEITDNRVKIENNQKVFDWYPYFSVTLPVDWKCYIRQGEDGSNYYFQDPILGDKCQLSARLAEAWTAKDRTEEEYRKLYSSYRSYEDVVIESVTKETVGTLQGTKVVYAYTYEGTRYIGILYDNYIDRLRVFDLQIVYPADQKDTYESIFAAIMDSAVLYQYPD